MIDLFELCFLLSTILFFYGDFNKHQIKKKSFHSWYFMVFLFLNIFSLLRTSSNVDKLLWIFTKFRLSLLLPGMLATTYILTSDVRLQTLFLYRISYTYPFERTTVHRNSVHQFKTNHFYSSLKNPEHKTKSLHKKPHSHLPPPAASQMHVHKGFSICLYRPDLLCCI